MMRLLWIAVLIPLIASGCAAQGDAPAAAVEGYLGALVARDYDRLAGFSCAGWEAQARTEFDSFTAVTTQIEGLQCQQAGVQGEFTQVTCSGKITANYGNEVLEINLADQTYLVRMEGGEWRMCGYR
ncbi:MAG: hypothetical protein PHS96_07265 [Anaerolineales bacterium]|nr:hypothetical protein [Anaerolineales bacterium]